MTYDQIQAMSGISIYNEAYTASNTPPATLTYRTSAPFSTYDFTGVPTKIESSGGAIELSCGALVSTFYMLHTAHVKPSVGDVVYFLNASNVVKTRTVASVTMVTVSPAAYDDVYLVELNAAITVGTDGVSFYKLPSNWLTGFVAANSNANPLLVAPNRLREIQIPRSNNDLTGTIGYSPSMISGDSGKPAFWAYNSELLLVIASFFGASASAAIAEYVTEINAAMGHSETLTTTAITVPDTTSVLDTEEITNIPTIPILPTV